MSKHVIVEYELKPEKLEECVIAINRFIQAVRTNEPHVLRYEAYRRGKTMHFVHLIEFADDRVEVAHKDMPHTKQLIATLYPSCASEPVFTELTTVGPADKEPAA